MLFAPSIALRETGVDAFAGIHRALFGTIFICSISTAVAPGLLWLHNYPRKIKRLRALTVEERKILGEYVTMRTRSVRFDKRRGPVTVLIDDGFLREADPTTGGHRPVLIDEWAFHHLMAHKELLVVSAAEEDQGSAR
jgi:hypothetical protein